MKDYYAILEINESASKETIEKVHKLLVKRYHPDLQEESKKAGYEEKMKEINEAYAVLTDSTKKKLYDEQLKEYRMQKIMDEIRAKQATETARRAQEQQQKTQEENRTNNTQINRVEKQQYQQVNQRSPFEVSDEEIRRQAQVYYDELYRQYLYYNGYVKEDFKTVAKRYITVILTIVILLVVMYVLYKIPYFNELLKDIVDSNEILKNIFGKFFE